MRPSAGRRRDRPPRPWHRLRDRDRTAWSPTPTTCAIARPRSASTTAAPCRAPSSAATSTATSSCWTSTPVRSPRSSGPTNGVATGDVVVAVTAGRQQRRADWGQVTAAEAGLPRSARAADPRCHRAHRAVRRRLVRGARARSLRAGRRHQHPPPRARLLPRPRRRCGAARRRRRDGRGPHASSASARRRPRARRRRRPAPHAPSASPSATGCSCAASSRARRPQAAGHPAGRPPRRGPAIATCARRRPLRRARFRRARRRAGDHDRAWRRGADRHGGLPGVASVPMAVALNHTIVPSRDPATGAAFLAEILGPAGPAAPRAVPRGRRSTRRRPRLHAQRPTTIPSIHYAFLVSEEEFDEISGRIVERGVRYFADPAGRVEGEINTNDGGRGCYFSDPDGHWLEIITRPDGWARLVARRLRRRGGRGRRCRSTGGAACSSPWPRSGGSARASG